MTDAKQLIDRYVAMWNEPDADRRRRAIAELWTEDAVHLLAPPQEVRAYEDFVAPGELVFRARDNAERLRDVVKFNWEMVRTDGGAVEAVGLDVFVLAADGRIRSDYQFIEA